MVLDIIDIRSLRNMFPLLMKEDMLAWCNPETSPTVSPGAIGDRTVEALQSATILAAGSNQNNLMDWKQLAIILIVQHTLSV